MSDTDSQQHASADVSVQRLARVYGTALLDSADKSGAAQEVIAEIDSLVDDVFRAQPQLEIFFTSAAVGRAARREAIQKAFEGRASDLCYRFLQVLNDHDRLNLLRDIRRALHDLDNERRRRVVVHVSSAVPLTEEQQARVIEGVRQRFGMDPILQAHVDPSLLGGIKLRIGDRQIDATVRTRLDDIRNQILAKGSYEIQSRRDRFRTQ